ncbi:MAG: hypothetical protein LQ350_008212 [Teloschistes chrysophthalmus]|nr:MAG: hypothetical protein LQ350_008212 [Niorma chrysophthalma]
MGCTEEQGTDLKNIWAETGRFISEQIIPDAQLGYSSKHGLQAMFSARSAARNVAQVFQDINDHSSVRTLNPAAGTFNYVVACTNPVNGGTDWLSQNVEFATKACTNGKQKFVTHPDLDIFVCPEFFEIPDEFPGGPNECPAVKTGRFDVVHNSPTRLTYNRLMVTINTLARKYVANAVPDQNKIFDINDCLNASPTDQLNNGFNYAYYAAFVVAGCTNFPTPSRLTGRHLLGKRQDETFDPEVAALTDYELDIDGLLKKDPDHLETYVSNIPT